MQSMMLSVYAGDACAQIARSVICAEGGIQGMFQTAGAG